MYSPPRWDQPRPCDCSCVSVCRYRWKPKHLNKSLDFVFTAAICTLDASSLSGN